MSDKKRSGRNSGDELDSNLLWGCFVNWALTLEKVRDGLPAEQLSRRRPRRQ